MRGLENLPSASETNRPLLFVGNHARIGLYDMPYLIMELYLRRIKVSCHLSYASCQSIGLHGQHYPMKSAGYAVLSILVFEA